MTNILPFRKPCTLRSFQKEYALYKAGTRVSGFGMAAREMTLHSHCGCLKVVVWRILLTKLVKGEMVGRFEMILKKNPLISSAIESLTAQTIKREWKLHVHG